MVFSRRLGLFFCYNLVESLFLSITRLQKAKCVMSFATGTAGSAAPDVVSVQGVSGGTAVPVSVAGAATAALQTVANEHLQDIVDALVTTGTSYNWLLGGSTNANVMKASAGILLAVNCNNTHASNWIYVKFYNQSTSPNPATDTPVATLAVPPLSKVHLQIPTGGLSFANGIAWLTVTGAGHGDTTAVGGGQGIMFAVYM